MGQKILYSPEQMAVSNGIDTFSIYLSQNLHSRKLRQKKSIFYEITPVQEKYFYAVLDSCLHWNDKEFSPQEIILYTL